MGQLHAIFLESQAINLAKNAEWTISSSEIAAHAHLKALRLRSDDDLWLLNGGGIKAKVKLVDLRSGRVQTLDSQNVAALSPAVDVYLSPPKGDDLDRCVQICVELGVRSLYFFNSDHSSHTAPLKLGRLTRIAQASCEQSLNTWLPKIEELGTSDLNEIVARARSANSEALVFDEALAESESFFKFKTSKGPTAKSAYSFFIGPEGGWSENERATFRKLGITCASLGPIVLKVPTALCASLSVLRSST